MNQDEFKQKLSQVAEWEIPNVTCGGNTAPKKRGRKSAEELYQQAHEAEFNDLHNGKNPTVSIALTKVKVASCVCEDCGRYCENGRRKEISQYQTNRPHWRSKCITCGLNENPETGAFDLNQHQFNVAWSQWLRKTSDKPYAYKPKKEQKDSKES